MKPSRLIHLGCLGACLLFRAQAHGQVVRYRSTGSAKLQTATEVDTARQQLNRRGKSAGYAFVVRIDRTLTWADTIIYDYTLLGSQTAAAERAHAQKLQTLVGKPLPAFQLVDLHGKPLISASLRGKPVVLNLWFTSCGPCVAEMPALNRIQRANAHREVVFLAVTFNNKQQVQAFLQKQPFTFRHLVDARQYCEQFTTGYPTTLFVDRSGIIRSVLGTLTAEQGTTQQIEESEQAFYTALKQIE